MDKHFSPARDRYLSLRADETALEAVLSDGAERARAVAQPVLDRVRQRIGLGRRGGLPS